jgi:hypothetical protein
MALLGQSVSVTHALEADPLDDEPEPVVPPEVAMPDPPVPEVATPDPPAPELATPDPPLPLGADPLDALPLEGDPLDALPLEVEPEPPSLVDAMYAGPEQPARASSRTEEAKTKHKVRMTDVLLTL